MSSDSATALATQQSIKAYVDAQVTASDLDFQGDSGGVQSIDLDSETFTIAGTSNEITTTSAGNALTVSLNPNISGLTSVAATTFTGALTGNASTTTALATSRNIAGVAFDGTADISLSTDNITEGSNQITQVQDLIQHYQLNLQQIFLREQIYTILMQEQMLELH